jgi:hypothetical protein
MGENSGIIDLHLCSVACDNQAFCVCVDSELCKCALREAGPSIVRGMSMIRLVVSDGYRSLYVRGRQ